MSRPYQHVRVHGVQDRRSFALAKLPWIVRWSIDGRHRSKSFRTKSEAERYRSVLLRSVHEAERFDPATGEPHSWSPTGGGLGVHRWARQWLREQWPEWAPRTRASAIEALARFVVLATDTSPTSAVCSEGMSSAGWFRTPITRQIRRWTNGWIATPFRSARSVGHRRMRSSRGLASASMESSWRRHRLALSQGCPRLHPRRGRSGCFQRTRGRGLPGVGHVARRRGSASRSMYGGCLTPRRWNGPSRQSFTSHPGSKKYWAMLPSSTMADFDRPKW